jgi:glucokinase
MESFTNKGRFSELVSRIPVHVILNPKIALIGAAFHGLESSEE